MNQALLNALYASADRIPEISAERQYWFIRTNGGEFYQDFIDTKSIGIGFNLVTLADVNKAFADKSDPYGQLHAAVYKRYNTDTTGKAAGLIWRFLKEIKPGDVVVMPSGGSNRLYFGEVTNGDPFEVVTEVADDDVVYRKRRSVNWISEKDWYNVDSNVYRAFASPQALTQITAYGDYLDREMYALYTKGGETHVRLDIRTVGGIDGDDYFDMGHSLLSLCREFRRDIKLPDKGNKIEVRSNVQSPGIFEFIMHAPVVASFLASALTVALFGGHVKAEKLGIDIGTDGLLKGLSNFMMEGKKRQLLEDLRGNLKAMDAHVAGDIVLRLTGASPSSPSAPPTVAPPPSVPASPPVLPPPTNSAT
jgi:restriction system protein